MSDLTPEQERALVAKLERRSTEEQRRLVRFLQPNWSLIAQALKERDQARAKALRHLARSVENGGHALLIRRFNEMRAARLLRHWADKLEAGR